MIAGFAMAWPGMPAGKVEQLHGGGLLDIRRKIISNVLDDPADDPASLSTTSSPNPALAAASLPPSDAPKT